MTLGLAVAGSWIWMADDFDISGCFFKSWQ
jgi:hypothetical protein